MINDRGCERDKLGNWLREMRNSKGLTQQQLAELVEVNPKQISRYESGKAEMGALLYIRICEALSPRIDDLQVKELLHLYTMLTPEKQQLIVANASALAGK